MNNVKDYIIEQLNLLESNIKVFKDDPDAQEIKANTDRDKMFFVLRDKKSKPGNVTDLGGTTVNTTPFEIFGLTDKDRDINKINNVIRDDIQKALKGLSFSPNVLRGGTRIISLSEFVTAYEGVADNKDTLIYSLSFNAIWQ